MRERSLCSVQISSLSLSLSLSLSHTPRAARARRAPSATEQPPRERKRASKWPLVAVDPASPVGTFLAPVTARCGNASLPLHLLEFLLARFLVLTSELADPAQQGYRVGAMAISPVRLERAFDSLVDAGHDTAVSTADGIVTAVMALHASVSFVHEQWALFADDLIPLQCGFTEVDMAPLLFPHNLSPVAALARGHRADHDALPALHVVSVC